MDQGPGGQVMKPAPAARWRRLALLVLPVLAAHLALLANAPRTVQPLAQRAMRFVTRSVSAPAPVPAPMPQQIAATPRSGSAHDPVPTRPRGASRPAAMPVASQATQATRASAPPLAAPAAPDRAAAPTATTAATATIVPRSFAIPAPARLHYEVQAQVHGIPIEGQAHLAWRHDGQAYEATLDVAGPGLPVRRQRSIGRITAQGLAPGYFSDKARSEQATHFDRDHGRLVFSNNRPQAVLAAGMQDGLSVIVQLSALLAGDPAEFPVGTQVAIPTAGTREAQTWIFDVEGEEDLQLPGGEVHALKLRRRPRGVYDQRMELWLSPHMDYAPVRMRLTNPDGGALDQRWLSTDRG